MMRADGKVQRTSVKSLRKSVNALRRKVERETKRQKEIVELHCEQLRLSGKLLDLRQKEDHLYKDAIEKHHEENRYQ